MLSAQLPCPVSISVTTVGARPGNLTWTQPHGFTCSAAICSVQYHVTCHTRWDAARQTRYGSRQLEDCPRAVLCYHPMTLCLHYRAVIRSPLYVCERTPTPEQFERVLCKISGTFWKSNTAERDEVRGVLGELGFESASGRSARGRWDLQ